MLSTAVLTDFASLTILNLSLFFWLSAFNRIFRYH